LGERIENSNLHLLNVLRRAFKNAKLLSFKKTEVEIQRFLEKPFHFISWQISKRSPPEYFNRVFGRKEIPL